MRGEKGGTGGARERPQNDRRDAKGSTLDGGTAKATAADLQREKTPRNGRAGLDHWAVFPAQNVVFVNPPKDSPEYLVLVLRIKLETLGFPPKLGFIF